MSSAGGATKAREDWTPVDEVLTETLAPEPSSRLHALFDADGPQPGPGDALPPLWHWLHFLPAAAQADLGPDGHPVTGGFLPPAPHPRRMFAGADIEIDAPLRIGSAVTRCGRASAPEGKVGRTGPLSFVSVRYELEGADGGRLVERQTLVYRPAAVTVPTRTRGDVPDWPWRIELDADERLLFRYSALTYNAHRIHYDRDYATGVEGYPGLVVHGPLLATGLAEVLRRFAPDRPVRRFGFRAAQPAFAPCRLTFLGNPAADGTSVELVAVDEHGVTLTTATAELAPT